MNVLVFASQKGGSGKSTMAASVAVAAVEAGESVVAVDMDPQGTLAEWGRLREAGDIVFRSVEAAKLTAWIEDVRSRGKTSLLVIDTPGTFGPAVNRAMREASLCLVPVRPSAPDLKAAAPTVEAIQTLGRPFAFVLNGTNPVTPVRTAEAVAVLEAGGEVAPAVSTRTDFIDSMASGLGVTEIAPSGKAAAEIKALWNFIATKLETK